MQVRLKKEKHKTILEFETVLPQDFKKVKVYVISDRNYNISSLTDVALNDFDKTNGADRYKNDSNVWFPVVDICLEPLIHAEAKISNSDYCQINAYFNHEKTAIENGVAIFPNCVLTDWENGLYIPNKSAKLESFAIVKEFFPSPTISRKVFCDFELLTDYWGGTISVSYQTLNGDWVDGETIEIKHEKDLEFNDKGVSDKFESLNLCIEYIINSFNHSKTNPYINGLYLFYDADADTYRNGQWPWSWGTAVRLLLECAELEDTTFLSRDKNELINIAYKIGLTTLKFQISNEEHVANKFGTTRNTVRTFSDTGYEELVNSGSDVGFLAGWAWSKLYEVTKDERFFNAIISYLDALNPLLDKFIIPPQEWLPALRDWTDFTIDESGFGTEGIEAAFKITHEKKYQDLCLKYMNKHLDIFEREDGFWERRYNFKTEKIDETNCMARGLGWAMEGLLATCRCAPEHTEYLDKAVKMADKVISYQCDDGSWGFYMDKSSETYGVADKGTSLWGLLLYMLYELKPEKKYLDAARKALDWCMKNQYTGINPHAKGGIISESGESGITYRHYFKLCCQYTSAFMGLSLLKELKINDVDNY